MSAGKMITASTIIGALVVGPSYLSFELQDDLGERRPIDYINIFTSAYAGFMFGEIFFPKVVRFPPGAPVHPNDFHTYAVKVGLRRGTTLGLIFYFLAFAKIVNDGIRRQDRKVMLEQMRLYTTLAGPLCLFGFGATGGAFGHLAAKRLLSASR